VTCCHCLMPLHLTMTVSEKQTMPHH
jgi:hypothetical protein